MKGLGRADAPEVAVGNVLGACVLNQQVAQIPPV